MNRINIVYDVVLGFSHIEFPKIFSEETENNFNSNPSNYITQNQTTQQFYKKNHARESSNLHVKGNRSRIFLKISKKDAIKSIESKLK